ncbi:uncharacterized protein F54H12.2 [Trichonephila clavipes]|nr:uncharacterized protein F54H12.2 [Trichonephila clavipes]
MKKGIGGAAGFIFDFRENKVEITAQKNVEIEFRLLYAPVFMRMLNMTKDIVLTGKTVHELHKIDRPPLNEYFRLSIADKPTTPVKCSVTLNDKQVSSQANYAYRCIFDALLSPRTIQESMLTGSLFYKDTASKHESVELTTVGDTGNSAYQTRYNICKDSKLIDMMGPLHFDLSNQNKCLINSVNLRIKLELHKVAFALMSSAQDFKIVIQHASLFVRTVKVAPSIMIDHEAALSKGVIKMPIRRTEVKSFALSSGMQSITIANTHVGQIPTRLITRYGI